MDVCTGVGTGISTTSIPVPDASVSSVQYQPGTGTGLFRKFGTTSNPVPPQFDIKKKKVKVIFFQVQGDSPFLFFTFFS